MKQDLLNKSIEFARAATNNPQRLSGDHYIDHAMRVKDFLEEIGITDQTILSAAILHDSLKYQLTTEEELKQEFGTDVAYLVNKLTQIGKIRFPKNDHDASPIIQRLLIQLSDDLRALYIHLADRVDNIKTSSPLALEDRVLIANRALSIYAPLAYSVGIYAYTREFQDEALNILFPEESKLIRNSIEKRLIKSEKDLQNIKKDISEFLINNKIQNFKISTRTKSTYSIYKKLLRKAGAISEELLDRKINDLIGIRILLPRVNDCYSLLSHIQSKWEMIQEEYDDYIANPKPNGYQTLQTSFRFDNNVMCEVQIRTFDMHEHNEYGTASHLTYKTNNKVMSQNALWLKKLISIKDEILSEKAISGTHELFKETIFVFTPQYDLKTLPAKSTPVDFAYAIHSDIGNHCRGAKINGQLAKLETELQSGDVVEILTNKTAKPNSKWLKFVKTSEARKHIKKAIDNTKV